MKWGSEGREKGYRWLRWARLMRRWAGVEMGVEVVEVESGGV